MTNSITICCQVVQEYERAVIFRLGRLLPGGAKGPGIYHLISIFDSFIILVLEFKKNEKSQLQEYSLCCPASRLTRRSTCAQSLSEFPLRRCALHKLNIISILSKLNHKQEKIQKTKNKLCLQPFNKQL